MMLLTNLEGDPPLMAFPTFLLQTMGHNSLVTNFKNSQPLINLNTTQAVHTIPQSNGKAEKAVQTVENTLKKALYNGRDPYLALLDLRNTPVNDKIGSPVQQLMGRRTKTLLPTTKKLLLPKTIQASTVRSNIVALQQQQQKHCYDRCSKPLPQLNIGDNVRIQGNNE